MMRATGACLALAWLALLALPAGAGETRAELAARLGERLERARAAQESGRAREAEALYRDVLAEAPALGERSLPLARAVDGLADVLRETGAFAEAEPLYVRAVALWAALLGPRQPRLAVSLHNLGVVRLELGQADAAVEPLDRALALWTELYGAQSAQALNTGRARERCRAARQVLSATD